MSNNWDFHKIIRCKLNRVVFCLREEVGMSLVEALVAIAILSIGLTTFTLALSAGSISVASQDEVTVAQRLAQTQIESIKAATYDSTGASYSLISTPTGYSVSFTVDSAIYTNSDIQKVSVTVNHDGNPVLVTEDYKVNR